ncbi:stalk domain-containing protein [Brevibacillus choshinensis]|uniref:Cupredoxin domain-containing protein n=1 Tax=Brevibacillus choshinensis TaxID=54911 RepID=A0ABX7FQD1_BRECH|nr:stalk domain-containing protein [Brevibacillus choshinensis]QRG67521.1 cupredoxin domain-containing protein [Brevibacillus choshinensis]
MKKSVAALFASVLLSGAMGIGWVFAAPSSLSQSNVTLDGKPLHLEGRQLVSNNHLMLPANDFARAIGAAMVYDQAAGTVTVQKEANTYRFTLGSMNVTINGSSASMDTPASLVQNVPYVPIRFLAENLGMSVDYDKAANVISLQSAKAPSLRIVSPASGGILYADQVKVSVAAFQHHLADFREHAEAKAGEGHIHVWLDTDPADPKLAYKMINGEPAVFDKVPPGIHTLTVQLVGNDHKPIAPAVKQAMTFTTAATPTVAVNGVEEGAVLTGDKVTVSTALTNFKLADFRTHSEVAPGEGHVHLWLDTDASNPKLAYKQVTASPVTFENVKPGNHTLTVQLVGADHKPILPVVKKVIHFQTTAKSGHEAASHSAAPAPATPARGTAATTPATKSYTVDIQSFSFKPGSLTIEAGSTVTFKNLDDVVHTVTAKNGIFDSGPINKGAAYTATFSKPGVYAIYCKPHTFMTGTITVK